MRRLTRLGLALGIAILLGNNNLPAQPAFVWEHLDELPKNRNAVDGQPRVRPEKFRAVHMDRDALGGVLAGAPKEAANRALKDTREITLPMPDGTSARFRFAEIETMEPELAAKFPEIKTYAGVGIDDSTATIRFDVNPRGFHAQILSAKGAAYIDPYYSDDAETHVAYYKSDYAKDAAGFQCLVGGNDQVIDEREVIARATAERSGTVLRTYRLACAATGEYTAYHGGTVPNAMAAIVTAINRVNQVYERDLSIRLILIGNNNLIVYTNGGTDPYTNIDGEIMLDQNQATLTSVIGNANYDIGHVFSTGGGGIAWLGSVCSSANKARGVTGLTQPTGDPFYIDYVAHEIGHQFGANHTFNSTTGSCGSPNRNAGTAYEPGSGSTIMGYAGICGANDLQNFSDPYFHSISFDEIMTFLAAGGNCSSNSPTGNSVPTVSAGPDFTIPEATPFTLTATGFDANNDSLTYCWEQRDIGASQSLTANDNGSSPLFRSFNPTASPSRTFPQLASILANTNLLGEKLPTQARAMDFRVTVRDNRLGGGGVNTDDMVVNVDGNSGPFRVTTPNSSVVWSNFQTVVWNVAGTTGSPVNCSAVDILLSTDGGLTFPTTLISNTPNDGTEVVLLPNVTTATARIKIKASANIFFDISDANFSIIPVTGSRVRVAQVLLAGEGCAPTNNAIDPGETVQIGLNLFNEGPQAATNVTVRLLADTGVLSPSADVSFGNLQANVTSAQGQFVFVANASCGGTLPIRFEIRTNGVLASIHTNVFSMAGGAGGSIAMTNSSSIYVPALELGVSNGPASPYPSTIDISGAAGAISKLTVTLQSLKHTYPKDVQVLLVGPNGQNVILMADAGTNADVSGINLTFDDAAATNLPITTVLTSGTYRPSTNYDKVFVSFYPTGPAPPYGNSLSVFSNMSPNGKWSLYVRDAATSDIGAISNGWRMQITTKPVPCCVGNSAPTISSLSNQSMNEDSGSIQQAFTISDGETAASSLSVTAVSSNTTLVPNGNLSITGSGSSRTLTLTPALNQFGSSTITVSVSDGAATTTRNFTLTVNPVNDAPLLAPIANRTIHQGATLTITNSASDVDHAAGSLSYSLLANPAGASIGLSSGVLTWTPALNQVGTHQFSVRVSDTGSPVQSDSKAFSVVVVPRPAQTVTRSGNQFTISWNAIAGRSYLIQMKTNLNDSVWQTLTQVTPGSSAGSYVEQLGTQQKFYRIQIVD